MSRTVMLVALVLLIAAVTSGGASAQIIDPAVHNLRAPHAASVRIG